MFDMKASNKSLMVIRLRGALIRKGYRMRATQSVKANVSRIKSSCSKKKCGSGGIYQTRFFLFSARGAYFTANV